MSQCLEYVTSPVLLIMWWNSPGLLAPFIHTAIKNWSPGRPGNKGMNIIILGLNEDLCYDLKFSPRVLKFVHLLTWTFPTWSTDKVTCLSLSGHLHPPKAVQTHHRHFHLLNCIPIPAAKIPSFRPFLGHPIRPMMDPVLLKVGRIPLLLDHTSATVWGPPIMWTLDSIPIP